MAGASKSRQPPRHGEGTCNRADGPVMDPDVFVTIAFSGYAVLAVLGIGAVLGATSGRQDISRDDEGALEPKWGRRPMTTTAPHREAAEK